MGARQSRDGGYVNRNSSTRGSRTTSSQTRIGVQMQSRYGRIGDNYQNLEQVLRALKDSGLESSNLIVGIDFTKSNDWTGRDSFNGRCLHGTIEGLNPYEQAISIIGRTLSAFDENNLIPCFGFGDVSTHDQNVFSFYPDNRPCKGFEEVLSRYREIIPSVRLSGPTSFAPIIETATGIVDASGGLYHVLLIIADGQVTGIGQLSTQEQHTVNAIVKSSEYALSNIMVGVGDGPWDKMREFDDNIPARAFDNFQFVNFTEIMSRDVPLAHKEAHFALYALMEIPIQFRAIQELHLLRLLINSDPCQCSPLSCEDMTQSFHCHLHLKYGGQLLHAPFVYVTDEILRLDVDIGHVMTVVLNFYVVPHLLDGDNN